MSRPSPSSCSACRSAYQRGYAAGIKRACKLHDAIKAMEIQQPGNEFRLHLKGGGKVLMRGVVVVTPDELDRIQKWVAHQLIISEPNT